MSSFHVHNAQFLFFFIHIFKEGAFFFFFLKIRVKIIFFFFLPQGERAREEEDAKGDSVGVLA